MSADHFPAHGPTRLVLVKHALPTLDARQPARQWQLSAEGRAQAVALGEYLSRFSPLRLITSAEPKAVETAELVAETLGVAHQLVEGLHELDRPALPIFSRAEHERLNAPVFSQPDRAALGVESADAALDRFSRALRAELARDPERSLVVITHGTVIASFVAACGGGSAFDLWKRLACPSLIVLDRSSLALIELVERLPSEGATESPSCA